MNDKVKYKIKCYWKSPNSTSSEESVHAKFSVKLEKDHPSHGVSVVVKDNSEDLAIEYRGKKVLKIEDDGNGISFKARGGEVYLDACEEQNLLVALLARSKYQGWRIEIK